VEAVEEEARQAVNSEGGLVGMLTGADGPGTHREAGGGDAGVAERDRVGRGELLGEWRDGDGAAAAKGIGCEKSTGGEAGGAVEKVATEHKDLREGDSKAYTRWDG
jgi:hypothetical protein